RLHAKPVCVDIDPETYNLDPDQLLDALETGVVGHISKISFEVSKVKAIIPVHLYGQCSDMENILKIASKFHIPIIEDAAQAIGAEFPMGDEIKKAGSMGIMGCFSFFPSKNLGCMGDGGMVVTNDESLSEKLRILRVHGGNPKYFHKIIGGNFRLDPIQAAILIIKYPFLNQWHIARQQNADQYNRLFQEAGLLENGAIKIPQRIYQAKNPAMKFDHIYNQYVIRVKDRDNLKTYLKSKGIVTEIYYPVPFHLQDCFAFLGYQKGDFPESEKAADSTLALPIYPEITEEKQNYVVECMKDFLTKEIVAWI
ncbi:MAG: DegT/DnrJ/EryC1/StrS family aminotransferase, partial [Promethearchaeota archaeon]